VNIPIVPQSPSIPYTKISPYPLSFIPSLPPRAAEEKGALTSSIKSRSPTKKGDPENIQSKKTPKKE